MVFMWELLFGRAFCIGIAKQQQGTKGHQRKTLPPFSTPPAPNLREAPGCVARIHTGHRFPHRFPLKQLLKHASETYSILLKNGFFLKSGTLKK